MGNWTDKACKKHYLLKIPFRALRILAGFGEKCGSCHWERNLVDMSGLEIDGVPIQQCIFPFVEKMEEEIMVLHSEGIYKTTANGFVQVLKQLRTIILQDAAVLSLMGRKHMLFDHWVFKSEAFSTLKKRMKILLDGNETEKKVDSQNLCEEMNEKLTGIQRTVHTKIGQLSQVVHDCNNKTTKNFGTLEDKINKIPKNVTSKMHLVLWLHLSVTTKDIINQQTQKIFMQQQTKKITSARKLQRQRQSQHNNKTMTARWLHHLINKIPISYIHL